MPLKVRKENEKRWSESYTKLREAYPRKTKATIIHVGRLVLDFLSQFWMKLLSEWVCDSGRFSPQLWDEVVRGKWDHTDVPASESYLTPLKHLLRAQQTLGRNLTKKFEKLK